MGSAVSLVHTVNSGEELRDSVSKALDLIDFKESKPVNSVAIKVNLCYYWKAATGYTTDPQVVSALIDCIRERFGQNINIRVAESDATAMRTKYAFKMLDYEKMAKNKNVELLNLSQDDLVKEKVEVNGRTITFKIPTSLLKCDLFVNVPKLKVQIPTHITCALKNIFGCIATPRKIKYHPFLDEAIIGINKILRPNLTIVDGIVALGRFPIKLGLIMASTDPFTIDWIASKIMGYNPSGIGFLKVAMKEGLGSPEGIEIRGEDIQRFRKIFPKVNHFKSKWSMNLQKSMLRLYINVVNDVLPPALEEL